MTMPTPDPPLRRFRAVDTRSPEEAREAVGRIFCPHFLTPTARQAAGFHARHHSAAFADFSVNYVAYGAAVDIDPGALDRFYLLQVPLAGAARVRCGREAVEVAAGRRASLLSPTLPTRMTWGDGCEKLIMLVDRGMVEARFAALAERPGRPVAFRAGVDLTSPAGRGILRHLSLVLETAEDGAAVPQPYLAGLAEGMVTLLLTSLEHDGSADLARPSAPPAPAALRRAEAFIADRAARPIALTEVAAAAGLSLRALQEAFRRHRGITPGEALQAARLERFRAALLDRNGPETVAEIAFAAGFGHLGRAAAAYRTRWGETPSETLRRRR